MRTTTTTISSSASGSDTSSPLDSSHLATLTSDPLPTCEPMTCAGTPSAISSQESEDGVTRSGSQGGPTTDLFGREVAHASPSASRAPSVAAQMSATYGLRSSASSASVALQQSLANRLQERLASRGSTMFALTWKAQATPLRRQICRLAASARRTSGSDCGGWPTPNSGPQNDNDSTWEQRRAELKAKHGNGNGFGLTLGQAAMMASWATPNATDSKQAGNRSYAERGGGTKGMRLNDQVRHSGPISNGSHAQTESRGQLNPAFSLWLMGYPIEWAPCAEQVTRLSRKSQQRSSAR